MRHPPRIAREVARLHVLREPETREHGRGFRFEAPTATHRDAVVQMAILLVLVVGGRHGGHAMLDLLAARMRVLQFLERSAGEREDAHAFLGGRFGRGLRKVSDDLSAPQGDGAAIRVLFAGDDLEQSRLACAVDPEQRHTLVVLDAQRDGLEDIACSEGEPQFG